MGLPEKVGFGKNNNKESKCVIRIIIMALSLCQTYIWGWLAYPNIPVQLGNISRSYAQMIIFANVVYYTKRILMSVNQDLAISKLVVVFKSDRISHTWRFRKVSSKDITYWYRQNYLTLSYVRDFIS